MDEIANVMNVHPAAIVLTAYSVLAGSNNAQAAIDRVLSETREMLIELAHENESGSH